MPSTFGFGFVPALHPQLHDLGGGLGLAPVIVRGLRNVAVGGGVADELDRGAGLDGLRDRPAARIHVPHIVGDAALPRDQRHLRRYSLPVHGRPVVSQMTTGPDAGSR
jgi:hypothetical protein